MDEPTGWGIPKHGNWCLEYGKDVLGKPGFFYDPPDIYTTIRRTRRIKAEYPAIHVWADLIAHDWYKHGFLELKKPARRNRIVAAMMYRSRKGSDDSTPRLAGIAPYLVLLRKEAIDRTVQIITDVVTALAELVGRIAGLEAGTVAKDAATAINKAVRALEKIVIAAENGELGLDDLASIAEVVMDVLDDVADFTPSTSDNDALEEIAKKVADGTRLATAFAQTVNK